MKREILCPDCSKKMPPMHPDDVMAGIERRMRIVGRVKKPKEHTIVTHEQGKPAEVINLPWIACDHCNTPLFDGAPAVAVTWWRPAREGEPDNWENQYQ